MPKSTKAVVSQRVEAVLRVRLAGAMFMDIRVFAAKSDPENGKEPWGVSDTQLRRYMAASDDLLAQWMEPRWDKLLNRHLAKRHHLFARAVQIGDLRTALAILRDEGELQRLYEPDDLAQRVAPRGSPPCRPWTVPAALWACCVAVPAAPVKLATMLPLV
jgi:hypothetical protein